VEAVEGVEAAALEEAAGEALAPVEEAERGPAVALPLVHRPRPAGPRQCRAALVQRRAPAAPSVNQGLAPHVPAAAMLGPAAEMSPGAAGLPPVN
jgi:hypothetical protein